MDVLLSLVPPEEVTDLVPFRPAMPDGTWLEGYLDPSATGRVSQCGTEAMLCRGSRIQMHCSQTGQLCAELCLRRRQERLLAGPFVYFRRTGRDFVAMAAQGALGSPSLLCVCHIPTECVVRAIHLPAPATHMAVVSVDRLGRLPGGWLAVATEDRWLLLLGLCLDSFPHHTDESKPLGLGALEGLCSPPALLETPVHPCVHVCRAWHLFSWPR